MSNLRQSPRRRLLWLAVALLFTSAITAAAQPYAATAKDDQTPKGDSRFTTLDGARIHYVNYGKGDEALVLIHGWTCNIDNWRSVRGLCEAESRDRSRSSGAWSER